jgi:hypothetical protein
MKMEMSCSCEMSVSANKTTVGTITTGKTSEPVMIPKGKVIPVQAVEALRVAGD